MRRTPRYSDLLDAERALIEAFNKGNKTSMQQVARVIRDVRELRGEGGLPDYVERACEENGLLPLDEDWR